MNNLLMKMNFTNPTMQLDFQNFGIWAESSYIPDNPAKLESKMANKRVVYVGGLAEEVDEKVLHAAFIPFGDVTDVQMSLFLTKLFHQICLRFQKNVKENFLTMFYQNR